MSIHTLSLFQQNGGFVLERTTTLISDGDTHFMHTVLQGAHSPIQQLCTKLLAWVSMFIPPMCASFLGQTWRQQIELMLLPHLCVHLEGTRFKGGLKRIIPGTHKSLGSTHMLRKFETCGTRFEPGTS